MAVAGARVTVGTTATRLDTATDMKDFAIAVKNTGANAVDLSHGGVTAGTGFQLATGESITIDMRRYDNGLFGITASGTSECQVLQIGG